MEFHELEAPERWIAALEDDRTALRSDVLNILANLLEPPTAALMPALRMVDRHGWEEAFEFSHQITHLKHTEESFAWLVARLHSLAPQAGKENELMHLSRWFCSAPVEWLYREIDGFVETLIVSSSPDRETIRSKPVVFRSQGASFETATQRLAFHHLSTEALKTRADELLGRCAAADSFTHAEGGLLELIAGTLAARGDCLREAAGEWLDIGNASADSEVGEEEYRAGFALMLLIEGRVKAPLDKMLNLLDLDWEWMNEMSAKALAASADATTISEILEVYPTLEWYQRLYLGGVIEDCWHRENEAEVLQAARDEDDDDLRVALASGLVLHGSPEAKMFARKVANEMPDDPERWGILEQETICEVVAGRETTATRAFLADMEQEIHRSRERFKILNAGGFPQPATNPKGYDPTVKVLTVVRTEPVIGRNDPCPCGSGKKYKKCCQK